MNVNLSIPSIIQPDYKLLYNLLHKSNKWNEENIIKQKVKVSDIITNNTNQNNSNNQRLLLETIKSLPIHSNVYLNNTNDYIEDGLYKSKLPNLIDLLLIDEEINTNIAQLTSSSTTLSRVTQRILREIKKYLIDYVLIDKWLDISNQSKENMRIPSIQLLNYLSVYLPILNITEDPIDESLTQPIFPINSLAYGGVIGNWSINSSELQRIGRYIDSKSNKQIDKRSIFRIHLHQLNILDHPLIINEERQDYQLKLLYHQYKALYRNRVINYLLHQLVGIIRELDNLLGNREEEIAIDDSIIHLLLSNLIDVLPMLLDLFDSMNNLTKGLIDNWQIISDNRKQQGFKSTSTSLKTHNLATYIRDKQSDNKIDNHIDSHIDSNNDKELDSTIDTLVDIVIEDNIVWKELLEYLPNLMTLLEKAKANNDLYLEKSPSIRPLNSNVWDKLVQSITSLISLSKISNNQVSIPYPNVLLQLIDEFDVTPDNAVGIEELHRRRQWNEVKYKLGVYIDGVLLTEIYSSKVHLLPFHVVLQQFVEIRVFHTPSVVEVKIYSINKSRYDYLSSVFLPTYRSNSLSAAHSATPLTNWYFNSSEESIDIPSDSCLPKRNIITTAARFVSALLVTVEYDVASYTNAISDSKKPEDLSIIPTNRSNDKSIVLDKTFSNERDFLSILPPNHILDINDPRNNSTLLSYKNSSKIDTDVFQLSSRSKLMVCYNENGISYDDYMRIQPSLRLQLLQMRQKKPFLFAEPVPQLDDYIKNNELYKQLLAKDPSEVYFISKFKDLNTYSQTNDSSAQEMTNKTKVLDFLTRIQSSRTSRSRQQSTRVLTTNTIISEKDYFKPRKFSNQELLLPDRKRGLKPKVQKRTPVSLQIRSCNLLVQVVSVRNVPLKEESDNMNARGERETSRMRVTNPRVAVTQINRDRPIDNNNNTILEDTAPLLSENLFDEAKLKDKLRARTVMEVSFQENSFVTPSIEGVSPEWKYLSSLPFHPPRDDFSPLNLQQVREDIVFTLFAVNIQDDKDNTAHLEGESTTREERRYIGRFTVPFSTLYRTGRVEGIFRADTPVFNFGYNHIRSIGRQINTQPNNLVLTATASSMWTSIFECSCFTSNPVQSVITNDVVSEDRIKEISYFFGGKETTYFQIMITFDPPLAAPDSTNIKLAIQSTINPSTLHIPDKAYAAYTSTWLRNLQNKCPDRLFKIFAMSSSGLDVFIPRYLIPQKPPDEFLSKRACLHLVSLIPFLPDTQSFVGESDLWCTTYQVFDIGCGDEEEHAVVLYNYFYYLLNPISSQSTSTLLAYPSDEALKRESLYLVLGKAIPEGDTVYILARKTFFDKNDGNSSTNSNTKPSSYYLINPCTGNIYDASDIDCPLKELLSIVSPFNYWANIQTHLAPSDLDFDVTNKKLWISYFNRDNFPYPATGLSSIQSEIIYASTGMSYALEVENLIKDSIKRNMRRWRSKRIQSTTTFHPESCLVLTETLPKLEQWKRTGRVDDLSIDSNSTQSDVLDSVQFDVRNKLRMVLRTRDLKGFPINFAFTDVENIIQQVKELRVHESTHPACQFVLAVRCFPLINNLLSVWIFLGTLESRR